MDNSIRYWAGVYRQLKNNAVCIDIERASFNGPISVIGWYEPKEGVIECDYFIRGQNLNAENLRKILGKYKLFITYNGLYYDVPAIQKEFPGVIPKDFLVLDLYLFAKRLNLNTNLKVLENTLKVERSYEGTLKKGRTIRLWQRYEKYGDAQALNRLLEYNKQDVVNLYPLAEELTSMVKDS
jgi:uncharacterized protein YprB with RNaseH-like and TPR domain